MITIFSVPKAMEGEFARIQANAVGSWRALHPAIEILLFGEETGVAECARRCKAEHIPQIPLTDWGTPRVDILFAQAEHKARSELLCYVNADIILGEGFLKAVQTAADFRRRFLLVGRRWDLDFDAVVNYQDPRWEEKVHAQVEARGTLHKASGIDYFVYRRGLWKEEIPAFAIGRTMWDNWLIWKARASGAAVIDGTECIWAVHQNHEYNHHPLGWQGVWKGPEAKRNEQLAGGLAHYFTIDDATHQLTREWTIRRFTDRAHRRRWWATLPVLWRPAALVQEGWRRADHFVRQLRVYIARVRGRVK